jgi:hypothetical protein
VLEGEALRDPDPRPQAAEGETLALPADVPMRAVVTGSTIRRLLAISFTMRRCLPRHAWSQKDSTGAWLDGGKSYALHIPKDAPVAQFWSFTVYDNEPLPD